MDFKDTPQEAEFRAEVQAFLAKNAPEFALDSANPRYKEDIEKDLGRAKAWQARKAEAGYVGMTWPKKYGGQERSPIYEVVYKQEEEKYDVPRGYFEIGLGMAAPTLMAYATEEQKERYLPKMRTGEEVWCQLFSEPAAGSDLAGLRTRAERDGDDWIVNGQKVWTSGAFYSDYGIVVTRHDPNAPKHIGLTYFFIDMHAPGVEVRRIKQISGGSNFCEVFFTDMRVPDAQRLGEIGGGWGVSLTTLMNERLAVGSAPPPKIGDIVDFVKTVDLPGGPAIEDGGVREKLADWYVQSQGLLYTKYRTMTALSQGQTPGPEASIEKVVSASNLQDMASFAMDLQETAGIETDPERTPEDGLFPLGFLYAPGYRIAGGTDEILRNIIAERVLGMPREIRVDKEVPFNELPTGA